MTIYDVPVADTTFFPVSGDMMRQMKADEERRDRIIRERLAKHRAEHLIGVLRKENGTGDPAKNLPDAADPNTYIGEQTMQDDTPIKSQAPDTTWHPIWCTGKNCELTPGEFSHISTKMTTRRDDDPRRGGLPGWEAKGDITLLEFPDEKMSPNANVSINGLDFVPLDRAGLTQLIGFLEALRDQLQEA